MRVTKLELTDFGPHRKISADTDAAVVGLVGQNGKGKSNVLAALKFAFRGIMGSSEENLHSFIRIGADKARVKAEFRQAGGSGHIIRTITRKSTTRELVWNGCKPVTKDADVKSLLREIMGVDEYALENAVFIPQGALRKLLFGMPTEREEVFIKMMLLGYTGKVQDAANAKATAIMRGVQDLTSLRDEIRSQQSEAERVLAEAERDVRANPNMSAHIDQWDLVCRLGDQISVVASDWAEARDKVKRLEASRDHLVATGQYPDMEDVESVDGRIHVLDRTLAMQREALNLACKFQDLSRDRNGILERIAPLQKELDEALSLYSGAEDIESLRARIEEDKAKMAKVEALERRYKDAESIRALMREHGETLDSLSSSIKDAESLLQSRKREMESLEKDSDIPLRKVRVGILRSVRDSMLTHGGLHETGSCPLCMSDFSVTEESVNASLEDDLRAIEEHDRICRAVDCAKDTLNNLTLRHARESHLMEDWAKDLVSCEADLQSMSDAEEYVGLPLEEMVRAGEALLRDMISNQDNIKVLRSRIQDLQEHASSRTTEMTRIPESARTLVVSDAEAKVESMQRDMTNIRAYRNSLHTLQNDIRNASEKMASLSEREKSLRAQLDDQSLPPVVSNIMSRIEADSPETATDKSMLRRLVREELLSRQDRHSEARGSLDTAKANADALAARMADLDAREDRNKHIVAVSEELRGIRDAFGRKGLPRSYVDWHYSKLISATQNILESMDADFSIVPSPDEHVTLLFQPQGVDGMLHQSKLSGGQSMRVSLAFLIALQKMMVPSLEGFMCLDEPSTHLHEDGIVALRNLVVDLGDTMGTEGESQIWMSDHSEILATAFQKTIRL